MPQNFDHVVLGVREIDQIAERFRELGYDVFHRDPYKREVMEKRFVRFPDSSFIELIEFTGPSSHRFTQVTRQRDGWVDLGINASDLTGVEAALRAQDFPVSPITNTGGTNADGSQWEAQLLLAGLGVGNPALPFLIHDVTPRQLRLPHTALPDQGTQGILGVIIAVESLADVNGGFEAIFGAGSTIGKSALRYRCGAGWIEVVEPPHAASKDRDNVFGIREIVLATHGEEGLLDFGRLSPARIRLVRPDGTATA